MGAIAGFVISAVMAVAIICSMTEKEDKEDDDKI